MCAKCAREEGREARLLRLGLETCPYFYGTRDAFAWVAGWNEEDHETMQCVAALRSQDKREGKVRRL